MEQIAEGAGETRRIIEAIALAVTQQRGAIGEINANLAELSQIGTASAAAAEEIATTVMDLSRLAAETRQRIGRFRVS